VSDSLQSTILHIASELPEGDPTRRKLLEAAREAASERIAANPPFHNAALADDAVGEAYRKLVDLKLGFDSWEEIPQSAMPLYREIGKANSSVADARGDTTQVRELVKRKRYGSDRTALEDVEPVPEDQRRIYRQLETLERELHKVMDKVKPVYDYTESVVAFRGDVADAGEDIRKRVQGAIDAVEEFLGLLDRRPLGGRR
jgi:hypothetical protein